jgi:hypothetical protein
MAFEALIYGMNPLENDTLLNQAFGLALGEEEDVCAEVIRHLLAAYIDLADIQGEPVVTVTDSEARRLFMKAYLTVCPEVELGDIYVPESLDSGLIPRKFAVTLGRGIAQKDRSRRNAFRRVYALTAS